MDIEALKQKMRDVLKSTSSHRERQRLVFELGDMIQAIEEIADRSELERVRRKASSFLADLALRATELGDQFFVESFLLNSVGEIAVRNRYFAEKVVDFLRSGLYFFGNRFVERSFRHDPVHALEAHADVLASFFSRDGLKFLEDEAEKRFADSRPFCLTNTYANELRKRCWAERRKSRDACDVSVTFVGESESSTRTSAEPLVRDEQVPDVAARAALLLRVFATKLTDLQKRIYLARHNVAESFAAEGADGFDIEKLLAAANTEDAEIAGLTWLELGNRLGSTEKTVKREYLRSLVTLLSETSHQVFGDVIPSNFVRKILETLRTVIQDKELRLKDNSGRGLGKVVQRWEVALRFVLNHNVGVREAMSEGESSEFG